MKVDTAEFVTKRRSITLQAGLGTVALITDEDGTKLHVRHAATGSQLVGALNPAMWPMLKEAIDAVLKDTAMGLAVEIDAILEEPDAE